MTQGVVSHDEFGSVRYAVRKNSRKIVARWRAGTLHVTMPAGVSHDELMASISRMAPRLRQCRQSACLYSPGQEFDFPGFRVAIVRVSRQRSKIAVRQIERSAFEIRVSDDADIGSYETVEAISRGMKAVARFVAPSILLPRASMLAGAVGANPRGWKITSGRSVLGRCSSRGVISLSCVLSFLPVHLRDYVVFHELAHLTEMNHSAAFHALCDRYCGGRERSLEAELKAFRFPLV